MNLRPTGLCSELEISLNYATIFKDSVSKNKTKQTSEKYIQGWGCCLMVEHLPSMCKTLDGIPILQK